MVRNVKPRPHLGRKKKSKSSTAEITKLGRAMRTLGMAGGGAIGGYLGNPTFGATAGRSIGALVSKWLGQGDYTVVENSIVKGAARGSDSIPDMHRSNQSIVVRHKEFVTQIAGSQDFKVQRVLPLNPGLQRTFPWLASLAAKFEQYRIRGLVYHYVPTSGLAVSSTNPAIGAVMMQTSYRSARDPSAIQPTSKVELLNEYWASEAAPNDSFCHPIECSPTENPFSIRYVRTGAIPSDDSVQMYDSGVTFVATSGMPADGNAVGDLWVTYEVELLKPLVTNPVVDGNLDGYASTGFTSSTSTNMFGITPITSTGSLTFVITGNVITFAVGTIGVYQVSIILHGFVTTAGLLLSNMVWGNSVESYLPDLTSGGMESIYHATGTNLSMALARLSIVDPSKAATLTLTTAAVWTGQMVSVIVTPV